MILQLAPLSYAILSLAWLGDPGMTYTIQTSFDLVEWETLSYVTEGKGVEETYYLDNPESRLFVRLQFDTDGDTDNNALPDIWEWQNFGHLGVDPNADPDMDGDSTYSEWLLDTDPTDFFDGEWPIIHIASGKEWLIPAGNLSSNGISLYLKKPSGEPWACAPVYLSMKSGSDSLERVGRNEAQAYEYLIVWTDDMGRIDPTVDSIHVRASQIAGTSDELIVRAGQADAGVIIHSIGDSFGSPPRNLSRVPGSDDLMVYSWTGDPGEAFSFLLEEKNPYGQWEKVIEIATNELSAPDPLDGSYLLTIEN